MKALTKEAKNEALRSSSTVRHSSAVLFFLCSIKPHNIGTLVACVSTQYRCVGDIEGMNLVWTDFKRKLQQTSLMENYYVH